MNTYRLPNGEYTSDLQRYMDTWRDFIRPIEAALPGYYLSSFDPGVHFHSKTDLDYVRLSPPAARQLNAALTKEAE